MLLSNRVLEKERALGSALTFADIAVDVSGVYPRVLQQGELDAGVWSCGMVAGPSHDILTVRELIERIMVQADDIIRRLQNPLLRSTRRRAASV